MAIYQTNDGTLLQIKEKTTNLNSDLRSTEPNYTERERERQRQRQTDRENHSRRKISSLLNFMAYQISYIIKEENSNKGEKQNKKKTKVYTYT